MANISISAFSVAVISAVRGLVFPFPFKFFGLPIYSKILQSLEPFGKARGSKIYEIEAGGAAKKRFSLSASFFYLSWAIYAAIRESA